MEVGSLHYLEDIRKVSSHMSDSILQGIYFYPKRHHIHRQSIYCQEFKVPG